MPSIRATCRTTCDRDRSSRCQRSRSRRHIDQNRERCSHRNQQYSVTAVTDGTGTIVERYAYSAYGTPTITDASGTPRTTTAIGNRYTYTGREWDETLALHHCRERMYTPQGGRFCSRDPIGFDKGYRRIYEAWNSSPLMILDPSGLDAFVHPSDIQTTNDCESWRNDRKGDCLDAFGGNFGINSLVQCYQEVDAAADECVGRVNDSLLTNHLNASCCAGLSTSSDTDACIAEAADMAADMKRARDLIYAGGGPSMFGKSGHCTTCQQHVEDSVGSSRFFIYEMVASSAGFGIGGMEIGIPGMDHCWGQIRCKGTVGNVNTGPIVATIDFWEGGPNYWRDGPDGFGWTPGVGLFR